ncbi:MAG: DUF3172 domain-containing protein [Cyanobacteriota bacterium]|nr:DUF3172 domain-containing protein [Cyanobacteriota bacterium]
MTRSRPDNWGDFSEDRRPERTVRDNTNNWNGRNQSYGRSDRESRYRNDPGLDDRGGGRGPGSGGGGSPGGGGFNMATAALLAGVLVVGIGIGSAVTSTTQGNQGNIASSQQLDMAVPDPEFCKQWGASAFVMDIELYTTMNPSSSFVTQPTLQPGCVIRRENWAVLQKQGAVTAEQMRECKQRMNTFAYIGSIRDKPIVRCVYQTDISGNKFQVPGVAGAADDSVGVTPEGDQF